jgi:hypothetical protein
MAVTDEQLNQLLGWAREMGAERPNVADDDVVLGAVFDRAAEDDMRTLDEFDAIVTLDDLPAVEDREAIVDAWRGRTT